MSTRRCNCRHLTRQERERAQLRHTFATMLIREEGKDPFLVADLMGHEDLDTTRAYSQPSRTEMVAALDQINVDW